MKISKLTWPINHQRGRVNSCLLFSIEGCYSFGGPGIQVLVATDSFVYPGFRSRFRPPGQSF